MGCKEIQTWAEIVKTVGFPICVAAFMLWDKRQSRLAEEARWDLVFKYVLAQGGTPPPKPLGGS